MAIVNNASGVQEVLFPVSSGNNYVIQALLDNIPNAEILEPFIFRYYNKNMSRWVNLTMDLTPVGNDNYVVCSVLKTAWSERDANDATITGVWGVGEVLHVINNIANTTETHELNNGVANITIVGSLINYRFFGDVVANYKDTSGNEKTANFSVSVSSEGVSTANITLSDVDTNFDVHVNGEYKQFADITNNVQGTILSYNAVSHDLRVTLKGDNPLYRFTETPKLTYTDTSNSIKIVNLAVSVSEGVSTATILVTDAQTPQSAEVNGKYELFVNIVNNIISGVVYNANFDSSTNSLLITIEGNDVKKRFVTPPNATFTRLDGATETIDFSVSVSSEGVTTATAILNNCNPALPITLSGNYVDIFPIRIESEFCTISNVPEFVTRETILNATATANNYYTFETTPKIILQYIGNKVEVNFDVDESKINAVANVNFANYDLDNIIEIVINAKAVLNTEYVNRYGTINLYCVTESELKEFSKLRFVTNVVEGKLINVDYGEYVHSIKRVFCDVGIMLPNIIKVGNFNTNIATLTPLNDTIKLNCGFCEIPQFNNNSVDYESEISMFLPFIGFQSLPVDYVGKRIYLQYKVNLITCDAIAEIIYNNVAFAEYKTNIASDIIYKTANNKNVEVLGELKNVGNLNNITPYVIVKYFNASNKLYNNDCVRLQLSEVSGFAKVDEITNLNVNAIESEKKELLSVLQSGVIF